MKSYYIHIRTIINAKNEKNAKTILNKAITILDLNLSISSLQPYYKNPNQYDAHLQTVILYNRWSDLVLVLITKIGELGRELLINSNIYEEVCLLSNKPSLSGLDFLTLTCTND